MSSSLAELVIASNHLVPDERLADIGPAGTPIDTLGADEVLFIIAWGSVGAGILSMQTTIQESDAAGGPWSTVANGAGVEAKTALVASGGANRVELVSVRCGGRASSRKRYLRAYVADVGFGTYDNGIIALKRASTPPAENTPAAVIV